MDIREGMCYGECCELYKTDESETCTPETNNTLYVNKNKEIKNKINKIIFSKTTISSKICISQGSPDKQLMEYK